MPSLAAGCSSLMMKVDELARSASEKSRIIKAPDMLSWKHVKGRLVV